MMHLLKPEIMLLFNEWLIAWNKHDLEGVMDLLHDEIVFENWTGAKIVGKKLLRKAWTPWFINHENFRFEDEGLFFDEVEQKMVFIWKLEWPSRLTKYKGKPEIRNGVDVLYFKDGKLIEKHTYTKTTIQIEGLTISLEN